MGQSSSGRRSFFVRARRFLSARRRSTDARVALVGRRSAGGDAIASRRVRARRSRAASRFRSCERCSDAVTVNTPSTRRPERRMRARARCRGPSAVVAPRSRLSSTRESAVFTDWPPGPDDRLKRHRSSPSGTTTERVTRSGPAMRGSMRRDTGGRPITVWRSGGRGRAPAHRIDSPSLGDLDHVGLARHQCELRGEDVAAGRVDARGQWQMRHDVAVTASDIA